MQFKENRRQIWFFNKIESASKEEKCDINHKENADILMNRRKKIIFYYNNKF